MKKLVILMTACLAVSGLASAGDTCAGGSSGRAKPIVLIDRTARKIGGNYLTATYSFRYMNQGNVDLTRNRWDLLFEQDQFSVDMVVGDNNFIYDLGNRNCTAIRSSYPSEKANRPLVWLGYSDADPSMLTPTKSVDAHAGHCYLVYDSEGEDGRVIALFHVKSHVKNATVTLDQINVLHADNMEQ